MKDQPPKWADRFLAWYCDPDLLEEIQGDAHELYRERLRDKGRVIATVRYWWDVIRFLRTSNVKKVNAVTGSTYLSIFWNLDFRIALRNAFKNKFTFLVKTGGLAVCLAFTMAIGLFVVRELSYDRFHPGYRDMYRIGSMVELDGVVTRYGVSPFKMGPTLATELPEVVGYTRLLHLSKPLFRKDAETFSHTRAIMADSNFLSFFGYRIIHGDKTALDHPQMAVITESTARLFFGNADPIGQTIEFYRNMLEVGAVVEDVSQSHLDFDVIVSWDTFDHRDVWENINAYTYVRLHPDVSPEKATIFIADLAGEYLANMIAEYNAKYDPIIQNVADIHLGEHLDEDIAVRRKASNVYILMVVMVFFLLIGLVNYHNIALAELSTQARRFVILRIFGGVYALPSRVVVTDAVLTLLTVVPLALMLMWLCLSLTSSWLGVSADFTQIGPATLVALPAGFIMIVILSAWLNSWVVGGGVRKSEYATLINTSKVAPARKYFLAAQLCFSFLMLGLISIVIDQFRFINSYDKGIDHANTAVITLPNNDISNASVLTDELRKLSGVVGAEVTSYFPAGQIETRGVFELESEEGMKQRLVQYLHSSPSFFSMMKVKVVEGKMFEPELPGGPRKFLVNQTAVREFGWKEAVGKKIVGSDDGREGVVTGVVQDFHLGTLHEPIEPLVIFPANEDWGANFVYIKTDATHAPDLVARMEKVHAAVYPDQPFELNYLEARYESLYREDFQIQRILLVGLVISVIVTCLGVFGMSALLMALRTREMGIRKVVGANRQQLFYLHMKLFLGVVIISMVAGIPLIYYLSGYWLNTFAYRIAPGILHSVLPCLCIIVIVFATAGWHANRNALVNPADVLKYEN